MKSCKVLFALAAMSSAISAFAADHAAGAAGDDVIKAQNAALISATEGKGFGPQSPRDITTKAGKNARSFAPAPAYQAMNLCNIHFHTNAEHKGQDFMKFAGNGDGHGGETGFAYSGKLSATEKTKLDADVCSGAHGGLNAGDTVELHYVHSSAQVNPGPTLGACLNENLSNPQLRVEAQVFVLVNNAKAADFNKYVEVGQRNGYQQALNIPAHTGKPVQYAGSTTGPSYNEKGSPLQVSWSVRPKAIKVSAQSVGKWCEGNVFKEDHAHGVRNLVTDVNLLSKIK
jgi:carbonic anhydrase